MSKATKCYEGFSPTMRKFFDAMDNCNLAKPFTETELRKVIREQDDEYAYHFIKGTIEFSCFEAIRPFLVPRAYRPKQKKAKQK